MPDITGEHEHDISGVEAQIAILPNVKNTDQTVLDDAQTPETSPPAADVTELAHRPAQPRRNVVFAGKVVLLLVTILIMLADTSSTSATNNRMPTPQPTATATIVPTPTPVVMPGFQLYQDRVEGYMIQYPATWTYTPINPGIQFVDDVNNLTYEVQVFTPGDATSIGVSGDPSNPSSWVSFAMDSLAKQWQSEFQQVPGPSPAVTIGGTLWQSGVGMISVNSTLVRVQIYATVYNGKPYIISLWAADDIFHLGQTLYFDAMLKSFEFVPART